MNEPRKFCCTGIDGRALTGRRGEVRVVTGLVLPRAFLVCPLGPLCVFQRGSEALIRSRVTACGAVVVKHITWRCSAVHTRG
eukprot:3932785-Pleurochrysis_carterae.AAC.3